MANKATFTTGNIVITNRIAQACNNREFTAELQAVIDKYKLQKWQHLPQTEQQANADAIVKGYRVSAEYLILDQRIFLTTETDRTYTIIKFIGE